MEDRYCVNLLLLLFFANDISGDRKLSHMWENELIWKRMLLFCSVMFQKPYLLILLFKYLCTKWRRRWQPTPVLLPGESHGGRGLVGCSPWGLKESDRTKRLHFHFSLSCIGEGNGNPLQCSCPEDPRDGTAWWAAIYGVSQSRTWLMRLSSSSSSTH